MAITVRCGLAPPLLLAVLVASCATPVSRFDPAVTASFAHQAMRKLETEQVELYYPAAHQDEALRVVARLEQCLTQLRRLPVSTTPRPKVLAYLSTANFDNAYVQPQIAGYPQQMVLAHHFTLEFFNLLDLGVDDLGEIACHESVHYVQFQQVDGLWRVLNLAFGDLLSPNVDTESWFLEGLATYYEGRLEKRVGRPNSPIWRGLFDSGVALRHGRLEPGDLSPANRAQAPFGGNYLVGMHFVDWLAERYGEQRLWELVEVQGRSWFTFAGVALRFKAVYGKTPGALMEEWTAELERTASTRVRPPTQAVVDRELGSFARLAAAPDGALAVVLSGRDLVPQLRIRRPGAPVLERPLTRFLPGRPYLATSPLAVSGLGFSPDSERLYFVLADVSVDGTSAPRLLELDARSGDLRRTWEGLAGLGGGITADGRGYLFVALAGDTANIVRLDLATGTRTPLTPFTGLTSLGGPVESPDGRRIAYARAGAEGFDVWLHENGADRPLTRDGRFNYAPRWADPGHLVAMREVDGRVQAARIAVDTGAIEILTDAPFVALDPAPLPDGRIAFVNRDGWDWTLDIASPRSRPEASGPEVPAPEAPSGAPPEVLSDTPYHALDHLLVPTLRAPYLFFANRTLADGRSRTETTFGAALAGSDRLGLHNYAALVQYETHDRAPTFAAGYLNAQLAPVLLGVSGSRAEDVDVTDWAGVANASRVFWTTPVTLAVLALRRIEDTGIGRLTTDLAGAGASTRWTAVETTPYGGVRRGLSLAGRAYGFAGDHHFTDLRAEADGWIPLPLSVRHAFELTLVGRALVSAPDRLLRVGGLSVGLLETRNRQDNGEIGTGLPIFPDISFREPLRGYEDFELRTNQVLVAGFRYAYPFVIDRGWASILYVLPSLFVREVDLELFGDWARTRGRPAEVVGNALVSASRPLESDHRAFGAAVFLRLQISQAVPLSLYYQFAVRSDDHLAPLHLFGLAVQ